MHNLEVAESNGNKRKQMNNSSSSSKIPNAVAPGGLVGGLEACVDWTSSCRCCFGLPPGNQEMVSVW